MPVEAVRPPAIASSSGVKNTSSGPRMLKDEESHQEITAWAVSVKNYWRRDEAFYPFVNVNTKWDKNKQNYGMVDEHDGSKLKRKKEEMAEDLESFLEIMAGYVPEDHLRTKIMHDSTSFKEIITIIREYYGAEINAESELDFMKFSRKPQEPYRKFFERMASHAREHLVGGEVKVGSINTGVNGDSMTLSHLNLIVQIWLWKINPKLLDIVKKEYGSQLQSKKTLYELMPNIAKNMDNLLKTDEKVQRVTFQSDTAGAIRQVLQEAKEVAEETLGETEQEELENEAINKIRKVFRKRRDGNGRDRRGKGDVRGSQWRDSSASGRGYTGYRSDRTDRTDRDNTKHCAACEYAKKVFNVNLDTRHNPGKCPNKRSIIQLVGADTSDNEDNNEGAAVQKKNSISLKSFQTDPSERRVPALPHEYQDSEIILFDSNKRKDSPEIILADLTPNQWRSLDALVRRTVAKKNPRKEKSPSIRARIKGISFIVTIDEGAEMNILSAEIARKSNVPITHTQQGASSADGGGLKVIGQTLVSLSIIANFQGAEVELHLGRVVVVEGLEADVLLGEPGKLDNDLWTRATEKKVYIKRHGQILSTNYHAMGGGKDSYGVARLTRSQVVAPGQSVNVEVPAELRNCDEVLVNARKEDEKWFEPRIRRVTRGVVNIKNTSDKEISLKRGKPFGEFRSTKEENLPRVSRVVTEDDKGFRYRKFGKKRDPGVSYLHETKVDPDGVMTEQWRTKFKELLQEFDEVIDPAPGKYNGKFGECNTLINFTDTPPPIEKVYTPAYSREMQKTLADKMDKLIEWGVLVKADDIGVSVEHISASLLVPKTDGDGFRMVNDLSRLNTFIGKEPATSPSMQDVKNAIARKKHVAHLDLSNYFYQGGMRRQDAQFLGVIHPFNGLYVYVCEPQGLRNASEHAYERLGRIFGDMVREDRMTRHADGLHVLGDTEEELYINLREVLSRIQQCGLTLKPSKVEVGPINSVLFGWRLEGSRWVPTEHTTSALASCEKPTTVKKMRSFLGAFKQFTDLVPGYAPLLHPLEAAQAGRGSAEKIEWTDDLSKAFAAAQKATGDLEAVSTPRPTDKLHTFSDFSQEKRAVGGKMLIERYEDGKKIWLLAGHYSATIDKAKTKWLPCEGEAAGIKMTLSHFSPWIIENNFFTTHHTDNQPCVQAWNRLRKGAYSNSSRIASFLSELSMLPVNIIYRAGKEMHTSDFASRNPVQCNTPGTCQICKFANEIEVIGDKSALIRSVSVEDIKSGRSVLPLTQRKTWLEVQKKDSAIEKFRHLVSVGQSPNKHKTKGEHTVIKKLFRLYVAGDLMIDKDGAVLVKTKDGAYSGYAMVVPLSIYPGLIHTLHLRLDHPSKSQLTALTQRYFYCHGFQAIIEQVTESCLQCSSVKKLPKVLLSDTTEANGSCGLQFAADVMEQHGQKVLIVREKLTQFMWAALVDDQKADTLETALLTMILPITPSGGATVRTDGGTAFQSLAARTDTELAKNNIKIELGRLHNVNKNPQAENGVKEFEKEMLRYDPDLKLLKPINICHILKSINTRIRYQGLSSQEMLLKREMIQNEEIAVKDRKLAEKQVENRGKQSEYQKTFQSKSKKTTPEQSFKIGQFVFIRNAENKTSPRELHVVSDLTEVRGMKFVVVRKAQHQFRVKTYLLRPEELIPAPIISETKEAESDIEDDVEIPRPAPRLAEEISTDLKSQDETAVPRRPRRRSAERARELFSKVLNIKPRRPRKKKDCNPCLAGFEDGNHDEIYPVRGNSWNFPDTALSRAGDDLGGLALLADSFESDEDFSLSLLDDTYGANILNRRLSESEIEALENTAEAVDGEDIPPAVSDHLIDTVDTSRLRSGTAPAQVSAHSMRLASNPGPFHGALDDNTADDDSDNTGRDENLEVDSGGDHPAVSGQIIGTVDTPRLGSGTAPAEVSAQLLRLASNPEIFHDISTCDDEVFETGDEEVEVDPVSDDGTDSANKSEPSAEAPSNTTPRVHRPTSLSGLSLDRTQDLSSVLRTVHQFTPPAPPPVDRATKNRVKTITTVREGLRPRTQSLKEMNQGKHFPSWRYQ